MAILEIPTREELLLYEIISHPVMCGEFYRSLDIPEWEEEQFFEYSTYQKEYLCDFNPFVSLCCGRAVGKTVSLTDYIIWILINNLFTNEYIVYTVPNRVHLEPVFSNLIRGFRTNTLLKFFIEPKRGINSSTHSITLLNKSQLICRIAGQSGGANVVGLHTPIIIVDEAGYYPWSTWLELQPVLNTWQPGFKLFVSGVPTGLRESNVLYYADEVDPKFSTHRTSAHENPRYTDADEERNRLQYGGEDSEDYVHFVLGRHGAPTFAVFDRRLMHFESYPVWKIKFSGVDVQSYAEMVSKLSSLPPMPDHDYALMGVDLGYTDPTAIVLLYSKDGIIRVHARITLVKIKYNLQERLIDYLDTKYDYPAMIGVDSGNEQGLVHHLLYSDTYLHKDYERRLVPIKFGSWIVIGEDADGNDIKTKVKPQSVSVLQEYSNSHRIVYSSTDMELVEELERMTYRKTPSGELVYSTLTPGGGRRGSDHHTAALLCAMMVQYLKTSDLIFSKRRVKLYSGRWMI